MKVKDKQYLFIFMAFMVYMVSYFGKYSYSANINNIMSLYNVGKAETGVAASLFFFAYGAGQIINGLLCKFYNKRIVLSGALIISAIINLVVYIGIDFVYLKYLWFLNGFIQSCLWSSIILAVNENVSYENLDKAVLALGATTPVGTACAYGLSALCVTLGNFKNSFLIAFIILLSVGIIWFLFYNKKTYPAQELANRQAAKTCEAANDCESDAIQGENLEKSNKAAKNHIAISMILTICVIGLFMMCNSLTRDALSTWVPAILKETYNLPNNLSILLTICLPVAGMGGIYASVALKRRKHSDMYILGVFFAINVLSVVLLIFLMKTDLWVLAILTMTVSTSCAHGISNYATSIYPFEISDKVNSGLTSGVLNGCGYIGATICTYSLGAIADAQGWMYVFYLALLVSVVPMIICFVKTVCKCIKINKQKCREEQK